MKDVDKAYNLIKSNGLKYKAKEYCCWISYFDKDDFIHTLDEYNDFTYCENCIENILKKIREKEDFEKPENFKKLTYQTEGSPEKEDFEHCVNCGEIIEIGNIWTEQELDHWIDLKDKEFKNSLKLNDSCYELMKILDKNYGAIDKFPDKIKIIIEKILRNSEKLEIENWKAVFPKGV